MITSPNTAGIIAQKSIGNMFSGPTGTTMIGIFTGDVPNLDDLIAGNTSFTYPTCAIALSSILKINQSQLLGCTRLSNVAYRPRGSGFVVYLSGVTELIQAIASGTPKFAVIRTGDISASGSTVSDFFHTTAKLSEILIVTVGDEKSDADIQILGGTMTKDVSYTMTDLVINTI